MKFSLLISILLLFPFVTMCQRNELAYELIKDIPLYDFVYKKADISRLDEDYITDIKDFAKENKINIEIPDSIIIELLLKTQSYDTTFNWNPTYFPDKLLVYGRNSIISFKETLNERALSASSDQGKKLKTLTDQWNNIKQKPEYISYISYPLFDKTFRFAIVEYGYNCGNLCGKSFIYIYKLDGNKWTKALRVRSGTS